MEPYWLVTYITKSVVSFAPSSWRRFGASLYVLLTTVSIAWSIFQNQIVCAESIIPRGESSLALRSKNINIENSTVDIRGISLFAISRDSLPLLMINSKGIGEAYLRSYGRLFSGDDWNAGKVRWRVRQSSSFARFQKSTPPMLLVYGRRYATYIYRSR
jgi:hypothetical protein